MEAVSISSQDLFTGPFLPGPFLPGPFLPGPELSNAGYTSLPETPWLDLAEPFKTMAEKTRK